MPRSATSTLMPMVALALACGIEESTGPTQERGDPLRSLEPNGSSLATTASTVVEQAGDVGEYGSLALNNGRLHVTYYDETNRSLKYATCARLCTTGRSWSKGVLAQGIYTETSSSIEVGPGGRRYVTYRDPTTNSFRFATCAPTSTCTTPAQWSSGRVDPASGVGAWSSLALGNDESKQVSYLGPLTGGYRELRYAICHTACTQTANWAVVVVERMPTTGVVRGETTSLAIGPDGRRHITYAAAEKLDLRYATCAASCTNPANWQKLTIDYAGRVGFNSSLAAGPDGVLHVSYYDETNGNLKYARCAFDCTTGASWKKVIVASSGDVGWDTSLRVEPNGRVHVTSYHVNGTALFYSTCNADCTVPWTWSGRALDGIHSRVGMFTSLAVHEGVVHVTYYDVDNEDLKYLLWKP